MKVTDLMVGDWVICNHYQDKPFTKQFGAVDFAKGEYEFCEPIPLTEDILVKNGFQLENKTEDGCLAYRLDHFHLFYYPDFNTGLYNYNIVISTVHQLQHLLRLVGVQKEIEL